MFVQMIGILLSCLVVLPALSAAGIDQQQPTPPVPDWQKQLEALGYLETAPLPQEPEGEPIGVTRHVQQRSYAGLNLASLRHEAGASLFDMNGMVVYSWKADGAGPGPWQHVELCDNGDLLVLVKDKALLRVTPSGSLRWMVQGRFHHDMTMTPSGHIWAATRAPRVHTVNQQELPVLEDRLTLLDGNGKVMQHFWFEEQLLPLVSSTAIARLRSWASEHPHLVKKVKSDESGATRLLRFDTPADLFHLNSIEVLDREVPGLCSQGNLLISVRNLNVIAVIDSESAKIAWQWGADELVRQHTPTLLDNGNILIFDNGPNRGYSRVIEVDPRLRKIVWEYRGTETEPFFSRSRGSSQRLPNGNTLICETDKGRSFEVTREGEIVWEYYCGMMTSRTGRVRRAVFYRLQRLTPAAAVALETLSLQYAR
jgi:hypothetical protein